MIPKAERDADKAICGAADDVFRHSRACETCMRPELQAALVGAALLGKAET